MSGRHSLVHERGALLLGDVEVALDPLLLVVRGDRAEVGGRVERVACRVRPSTGRYQYAPARTEYRWQLVAFTLA